MIKLLKVCSSYEMFHFILMKVCSSSEMHVDWLDFSSKSAHSFSVKSTSVKTVPVSRPSSSSSSGT